MSDDDELPVWLFLVVLSICISTAGVAGIARSFHFTALTEEQDQKQSNPAR